MNSTIARAAMDEAVERAYAGLINGDEADIPTAQLTRVAKMWAAHSCELTESQALREAAVEFCHEVAARLARDVAGDPNLFLRVRAYTNKVGAAFPGTPFLH